MIRALLSYRNGSTQWIELADQPMPDHIEVNGAPKRLFLRAMALGPKSAIYRERVFGEPTPPRQPEPTPMPKAKRKLEL